MARRRTSVIQVMVTGDARDLNRATQQGSKGLGLLGSAAIAASKFVASSMTAIAGFSIREFAKFDDAMTKSTAIMGDLTDAMRTDMEQAAREVAKTTSFAASEAADAFFFLASAGLDAEQSIAALPQVAQFAQAGAFDLARATDLLTDAQSALGLTSDDTAENLEQLTRVSDVLVKANTLANASVDQFSEALTERAGAAMRELGVEIETGVAVLGVFADQGIKGSKAGTMLNTTLEGLTRTAREQSEAYDRLGVSVFDSEGNMRGMADIVGDLEGALDGMSTEARLAELSTLGLTRQARDGVIQLLGNADAIREYEDALRDAGGTTQEVADRQLESFNAQLGLLMSGFADVGITIGAALAGPLGRFVAWFQEQLPAIEAFVNRAVPQVEAFVDRAVEKFREFKSFYDENLAGPLGDLMERLRGLVGEGLDFVSEFRDRAEQFLMDFATAVQEADSEEAGTVLGQAIGDVIQMGFDRFMDFGKIVAEWAGEQDWVAIGFSLSGHMGKFAKGLFMGLTHSLNEETGELEFDGSRVAAIIVTGLVARIPLVRNMVASRAGIFGVPIIGGILRGIMSLSRMLTVGFVPFFALLGRTLAVGIGMAFGGTKTLGVIMSVITGLKLLFTGQFGKFFAALGPKLWAAFTGLGGLILGAIKGWWAMLLPGLKRWGFRIALWFTGPGLKVILGGIGKALLGILAAIVSWPGLIVAGAIAAFVIFIRRFRRWNENEGDEYESFGERIVEFIKQGFDKMTTWFRENVIQWFKDRFAAIGNWFSDQWDTFKDWGSGIIDGIIGGIRSKASELRDALVGAARNAWNRTKDFLGISSPSTLFMEVGENMMDGLAKGVSESAALIQSAVGANSAMAANEARRFAEIAAQQRATTTAPAPASAPINITVTSADPEAVVAAIRRYTRANGPLGAVVNV